VTMLPLLISNAVKKNIKSKLKVKKSPTHTERLVNLDYIKSFCLIKPSEVTSHYLSCEDIQMVKESRSKVRFHGTCCGVGIFVRQVVEACVVCCVHVVSTTPSLNLHYAGEARWPMRLLETFWV
jgi:hypothetical protein